jgi:hypothetical protein
MYQELTTEQVYRSVLAAYDSVVIINDLKYKDNKTKEEEDVLYRNEEHIRIMMSKDWFVQALTDDQLKELQAI